MTTPLARCTALAAALAITVTPAPAWAGADRHDVESLLSHVDLERPELARVKAAAADPARAAAELLAYFRGRTSVHHPIIDRADRGRSEACSPAALAIADDAIRNVLVTCPEMPRFDFGPRIDWLTNRHPRRDAEWIVQFHRHHSWTALAEAYRHTAGEAYAEAYCRQLADWLTACEPGDPAAAIAWRRLEMGIRGTAWTGHFNSFLDSPAYTPDLLVRHLAAFHEHAVRLTAAPYTRQNWGLMEADGTAFIAITFPEFKEAAAWRRRAIAHLVNEIDNQVLPDGMHAELCFGYHRGAITWFERTRRLAELNGLAAEFPPDYARKIERMVEVFARAAHPNGHRTMFGDDRHADVHPGIEHGARMFPENPRLQYLATGGRDGTAPPTALNLPHAGIASFRSGWDPEAIHFILKCGPDGGWHGQPDNGSFELFAFGQYLMPDSGCYVYGGDSAERAWFRQTRVHQTLTLDGRDSVSDGRQLLWQPGDASDVVVVENPGYPGLTHRRGAVFVKAAPRPFIVLLDDAIGDATGQVDLHFQLAPGRSSITPEHFTCRTDLPDGNVLLRCAAPAQATMEEEPGQVSFRYEQKEPRPAVRIRVAKAADTPAVRFATALIPYRGPTPPVVELIREPQESESAAAHVTIDGATFRVGYDLAAARAWAEPVR
jgi:heparan-sulfate lyase